MAITNTRPGARLTLAKGCMYIADSKNGPWQELGDNPGFALTPEIENLEVESAKRGPGITLKEFILSQKANIAISLREPEAENLKLYFMADAITDTNQAAAVSQATTIAAKLDKYVEILSSPGNLPLRKMKNVVVKDQQATPVTLQEGTDYDIDLTHGMIRIYKDNTVSTPVAENDTLDITYEVEEADRRLMNGFTKKSIQKYVLFTGNPSSGMVQRFLCFASITPDGEYAFINEDEVQTFGLSLKLLQKVDIANGDGLYEYEEVDRIDASV